MNIWIYQVFPYFGYNHGKVLNTALHKTKTLYVNQSSSRRIHATFPLSISMILNKGKGTNIHQTPQEGFFLHPAKTRYSILSFIPESTILYLPGNPIPTWNHSHQQLQRTGKMRLKVWHVFTCLAKHCRLPTTLKSR